MTLFYQKEIERTALKEMYKNVFVQHLGALREDMRQINFAAFNAGYTAGEADRILNEALEEARKEVLI